MFVALRRFALEREGAPSRRRSLQHRLTLCKVERLAATRAMCNLYSITKGPQARAREGRPFGLARLPRSNGLPRGFAFFPILAAT